MNHETEARDRFRVGSTNGRSGVIEEMMARGILHRVQFDEIWHKSRIRSGEQLLALAVLEQAVNDLLKYRFARTRRRQRLYREAYEWMASNSRDWPFSMANLCDLLNIRCDAIRAELLKAGGESPHRKAA